MHLTLDLTDVLHVYVQTKENFTIRIDTESIHYAGSTNLLCAIQILQGYMPCVLCDSNHLRSNSPVAASCVNSYSGPYSVIRNGPEPQLCKFFRLLQQKCYRLHLLCFAWFTVIAYRVASSTSLRNRNLGSPIRNILALANWIQLTNLPYQWNAVCFWWSWRESNPRLAHIRFRGITTI